MRYNFLIVTILQVNVCLSEALQFIVHPDRDLSITEIFTKYEYPFELHHLTTDDGYILTMHRIPRGRRIRSGNNPHPVVMVHGTCGSADNFIVPGPGKAIAYYLADRGFDVWLLNTRGNRYSRKHVSLDPDTDRKFWDFGWHEIGTTDIPSAIDYILAATNRSKVFYIGHSQGSTAYFAFASEKPEYNNKIFVAVNLAPSCFLGDTRSVVKLMGKHASIIQEVANILQIYELFPYGYTDLINLILKKLCTEMTFFVDICYAIIYFGEIYGDIDKTTLQLIFSKAPGHCSIKQLLHYFQIVYSEIILRVVELQYMLKNDLDRDAYTFALNELQQYSWAGGSLPSRKFQQYDYGQRKNLGKYGTKTPPLYSFSNMTAPIALYYALQDNLCPKQGVEQLATILPNLAILYPVPSDNFNHVDFIFGKSVVELINEPIHQLFKSYLDN